MTVSFPDRRARADGPYRRSTALSRPAIRYLVTAAALLGAILPGVAALAGQAGSDGLRAMVEADWAAQEARRDRSPASPAAVRDALARQEE